jgi:hypothetical protein
MKKILYSGRSQSQATLTVRYEKRHFAPLNTIKFVQQNQLLVAFGNLAAAGLLNAI